MADQLAVQWLSLSGNGGNVAPLVFPIAMELGINPIHPGIIMVVDMEIGMITPLVGLNLFVTSGVAGMPMMRVVRSALPFLGVLNEPLSNVEPSALM